MSENKGVANDAGEGVQATAPIRSDSAAVVPSVKRLAEFMQFVEWLATPGQFREPRTQKEFADAIGVCQDTLTDWKRHPQFWPLCHQALGRWAKDRIPDAIGGLYLNASGKGSPKAVEMFIRIAGMAPPHAPSGTDPPDNP